MHITATILGSGTSTGVPVIGCSCRVCISDEPKNKRLRASILLDFPDLGKKLVVDTSPDFRQQMLREKVSNLDAILYTHTHADHLHGFDDVRAFYFHDHKPLDVYGKKDDLEDIRTRFSYAFQNTGYSGVTPETILHPIEEGTFSIFDGRVEVEAFFLPHGAVLSTCFRIGKFAYATDFKSFPEHVISAWEGKIHTMIASGLHYKPHNTHSLVPETIKLFERLKVKKGVVTHLSHQVDYRRPKIPLGGPFEYGYDGLSVSLDA